MIALGYHLKIQIENNIRGKELAKSKNKLGKRKTISENGACAVSCFISSASVHRIRDYQNGRIHFCSLLSLKNSLVEIQV